MEIDISAKAVDLWCGIGGLSYGLKTAGIPIGAGVDIDPSCRFAFKANIDAEFIQLDIRQCRYSDISPHFGRARYSILVGCAPCQPFSTHANKLTKNKEDLRWNLIDEFLRLVGEGKPDVISMENVPTLKKKSIYQHFVKALKSSGYKVSDAIVACEHFGVPQRRHRLVMLASLHGRISLPEKSVGQPVTVRDSIEHLTELRHGTACSTDPMHVCKKLSPINLERIRASRPDRTWRDWPEILLPDCYRKSSGKSYASVYGRMSWNKPAPTLTTQFNAYGTGRFGHPEQDRALSLREGAILQSFPEHYQFSPPDKPPFLTVVARHIGNAVPPLLANAMGRSIVKHLQTIND